MSSPQAAKRPSSAYFQWANANRDKIKEHYKLTTIGEVGKKCGELWKALPEHEKKPFEEKYAKEKLEWDTVVAAQKAEMNARLNPEGAMKRPQSAYFQWFNENRSKIIQDHKTQGVAETGKKAAELWKALSEAAKQPFEDKYQADKKAYEEYKNSEEGKAILEKQKEAKQEVKDTKDAKQKKKGAKKGAHGEDADEGKCSPQEAKQEVKDTKDAKQKKKGAKKGGAQDEDVDEGKCSKKEPVRESKEKAEKEKPTRKRASPNSKTGGEPPAKKEKTEKPKKVIPRKGLVAELSVDMQSKCKALGLTEHGVPYGALLAKLLATPEISLGEEEGLTHLQANGGNLNKTRNALRAA